MLRGNTSSEIWDGIMRGDGQRRSNMFVIWRSMLKAHVLMPLSRTRSRSALHAACFCVAGDSPSPQLWRSRLPGPQSTSAWVASGEVAPQPGKRIGLRGLQRGCRCCSCRQPPPDSPVPEMTQATLREGTRATRSRRRRMAGPLIRIAVPREMNSATRERALAMICDRRELARYRQAQIYS